MKRSRLAPLLVFACLVTTAVYAAAVISTVNGVVTLTADDVQGGTATFTGDVAVADLTLNGNDLRVDSGDLELRPQAGSSLLVHAKANFQGNSLSWWDYTKESVSSATHTITTNDSSTIFDNTGAAAQVVHTLPNAPTSAGQHYGFVVTDSDGIRVAAANSEVILWGADSSSVNGYIESTMVGSALWLWSVDGTNWTVVGWTGTWALDGGETYTGELGIGTDVLAFDTEVNAFGALSHTNGDIYYYNSGVQRLAKGSDGEVLTLASGIPSWAAASGGTTAWTSDTVTGSWTTNTTYTAFGRWVGTDTYELQVSLAFSGAPDAGTLTITPPETPDETKMVSASGELPVGFGVAVEGGVGRHLLEVNYHLTNNNFHIRYDNSGPLANFTKTAPFTIGDTDYATFKFAYPATMP